MNRLSWALIIAEIVFSSTFLTLILILLIVHKDVRRYFTLSLGWLLWLSCSAFVFVCRLGMGCYECLRIAADLIAFATINAVCSCLTSIRFPGLTPQPTEAEALALALGRAETYADWLECAHALDAHVGVDQWRTDPTSEIYEWTGLQRQAEAVRAAVLAGDHRQLIFLLKLSCRRDFCGISAASLHTVAVGGTKHLVLDFQAELCRALEWLTNQAILEVQKRQNAQQNIRKRFHPSPLGFPSKCLINPCTSPIFNTQYAFDGCHKWSDIEAESCTTLSLPFSGNDWSDQSSSQLSQPNLSCTTSLTSLNAASTTASLLPEACADKETQITSSVRVQVARRIRGARQTARPFLQPWRRKRRAYEKEAHWIHQSLYMAPPAKLQLLQRSASVPSGEWGDQPHKTLRPSQSETNLLQRESEEQQPNHRRPSRVEVEPREVLELLHSLRLGYGRTALCLSGGGSLAMYHMGVVKVLIERRHLPRVISGTSGGSIVAGILAVYTDEELIQENILTPSIVERHGSRWFPPFSQQMRRFLRCGQMMDGETFASTCRAYFRGLTFGEAFARTERFVSIAVTPEGRRHGEPVILNHINSPDVYIWSAVAASCALPGLLPPHELLLRAPDGSTRPFGLGGFTKWVNGSISQDLPVRELASLFNVKQFIVSQVNPHCAPFVATELFGGGKKRPLKAFQQWAEQWLTLDIKNRYAKLAKSGLIPRIYGQDISKAWLMQEYEGNVTITPRARLIDWFRMLTQPSVDDMKDFILHGAQRTFPHVARISQTQQVERQLRRCCQRLALDATNYRHRSQLMSVQSKLESSS